MDARVEWIDAYKGILILLVLILHIVNYSNYQGLGYNSFLTEPFRDMRMPAFFFISGFLLSQKYNSFPNFFGHRFRQIVVPYFVFFLFNYLLWIFFIRDADQSNVTLLDPFIGMIKGKLEMVSNEAWSTLTAESWTLLTAFPLWFVTTLFIAEIYFFGVKKISKNNMQMLLILIVFALGGFILSFLLNHYKIRPWWNVDIAITATVFYGLGYFVKTNNLIHKISVGKGSLRLPIITLLFAISVSASLYGWSSMGSGRFGNPFFYYAGAFSGILALIFFVQFSFIGKNRILEYFGKNAYYILAFQIIAMYFIDYFLSQVINVPSEDYTHSLSWSLVYFILLLLLLFVIIEIFDKFLPFVLGRKRKKRPLPVSD